MLLWLTCTHGRFKCLQRNLRCYLDQDTKEESVMFICNSGKPLKVAVETADIRPNQHIYVDNCSLMNFQSVGEKYNHAIKLAMKLYPDCTVVCHSDDDDIFLPNHLTEGYNGYIRGLSQHLAVAYKPQQSYYRYRDQNGNVVVIPAENTLEPSIFVDAEYLLQQGYAPVSVSYHQHWLNPLLESNRLFIDPTGVGTLIYNWGDNGSPAGEYNIYKMSGSGQDTHNNFIAHSRVSKDMGDGILTPTEDNTQYYKLP